MFNFIVKLQELKHVCDSLEKRNANKEDVVFPQTVLMLPSVCVVGVRSLEK